MIRTSYKLKNFGGATKRTQAHYNCRG